MDKGRREQNTERIKGDEKATGRFWQCGSAASQIVALIK